MNGENPFHRSFYRLFGFKWRNPFITASKILLRGRCPRRILGIWDFENGRAVIGDALVFQEILLVLAETHGMDKVDLVFVNPPPGGKNLYQVTDPALIDQIVSVSRLNPRLGSVLFLDDNNQFSRFFQAFKRDYIVFPNPYTPFSTVSNWHFLTDFFERRGFLPSLRSAPGDLAWARGFLDRHAGGRTPVCTAMRRNPRDSGRNASAPEWIAFFDHAAESHPEVLFVVIGTREEVLPELTGRENLVFAKLEAESTLLQDLALIEACEAFVGHNSGVAFFSWVLGKPSLVFGTDRRHLHFGHAVAPGGRYNFLTDRQRLLWGPYGAEDIIGHFQEVVLRS